MSKKYMKTNKKVASKLWIMETIAILKWMKSPELFLGIFSAKLLFFPVNQNQSNHIFMEQRNGENKEKIEVFVWFLMRNYQQHSHSANSHAIWHALSWMFLK